MKLLRPLLGALSPGGPEARLSILIFHRVLPQRDPLFPEEIDARRFSQICAWLRGGFNVLPLDQAVRRLAEGSLPPRAAAITFDDGYADNHDVALPILQQHGLNATFFVATGFLNGGLMWNDVLVEAIRGTAQAALDLPDTVIPGLGPLACRTVADKHAAIMRLIRACRYLPPAERALATEAVARASGTALPRDLMMRDDQVQALHRAGMTLGAHTVTHPILARLEPVEAEREMRAGKAALEALLQAPVRLFAYPNGRPDEDYTAEHAAIAERAGFEAAVTTAWGAATRRTPRFQIPRFTPWDRAGWRFGLRMAQNLRIDGRLAQPAPLAPKAQAA